MTQLQTWFGPAERALFGWLSVPEDGAASLGVLLCAPMAEEARASHRTFRRLGEELAARGVLALRFDYDGTGDSAGKLSDPDRIAAWRSSIAAGLELLRSSGVSRLSIVGMRLGATLAADAAAAADAAGPGPAGLELESLVLWDPCASGNAFLREGSALQTMGENAAHQAPPDAVDTPGFRFSTETAAEFKALDVAKLPCNRPLARRILVLNRDGRPLPRRAQERLDSEADRIEWATAVGQAELLDVVPSDSEVPVESLTRIANWVAESHDPALAVPLHPPVRGQAIVTATPKGRELAERSIRLGSAGLFGIVTEPADGSAAGRPWLVLINVAAEQHIGPGRQWVEYARKWAALGFRCVRMDHSGVGDSPTLQGQRDNVTFAVEWLTEMPEVVEQLGADGAPVALIGLCSGAYTAMETALHTRVDAICALNPRLTTHEMSRTFPLHDPRRQAARPPIAPIAKLWTERRILGGALWRIYRQFAFWHAPASVVSAVVRTGTDLMILTNRKDAMAFREVVAWSAFGLPFVKRSGRFQMLVVSDVDHSLLTRTGQQFAESYATRYLLARYGAQLAPLAPDPTDLVPAVATAVEAGMRREG